jgi:parallel beta-helix repeat protein
MKILFIRRNSVIKIICIFLLLNFTHDVFGTNYYVASNGSDGNNGLSENSPWQTIGKVNAMMSTFVPGDQILFRRGDKFTGGITVTKSGTAGNPLTFGSYGVGELPEITGKKIITGWTVYSGNIYKATVTDTVSQIYIGEKLMTIARYPNTGFLKIDAGNSSNGFYDAALTQSGSYWNGSTCVVRTINWLYEKKTVSSFSSGNITFSTPALNPVLPNYGYFFCNKLSLLDTQNEWFYDKSAHVLYFYAPAGVNPNTLTVEAVTKRNGIFINLSLADIIVQDLKISAFSETGVDGYTANNITVQRCNINKITRYGIRLNGVNNNVYNNLLEDNLNTAVCGVFTGGEINNNVINRTGLYAGYGEDGYGYFGILLWSAEGTLVENNNIDSSGYTGIKVSSAAIIRNNVITYSLLVLNDGGGIYIGNSDGLQVTGNIISNSIGNTVSSSDPVSYASGIYVNDAILKNTLIQGNTVYACRYSGLVMEMITPSANNIVRDNLLYNNFDNQMMFSDWSSTVHVPVFNTVIKNNIMYSLQSTQACMKEMSFRDPAFSDYGDFDSNYYCNPYSEYVICRFMIYGVFSAENYNLDYWQSHFNEDLNSRSSLYSFSQFGVTDTLSSNLILNSNFTGNTDNWTSWPVGLTLNYSTNPLLDSGCMKIRWTGEGNNEGFAMSNNMSVTKGNYYQASFSCAGGQNGTFSLWGMSAGYSTFPPYFRKNYFSYGNVRKNYSIVVKADTSDLSAARLSFDLILPDSLFYLDNVNFYRVSVNRIDSTLKSKLFVNETSASKNFLLNGIAYKDINGATVTGSISLPPFSSKILVNDNPQIFQTLNLTVLQEGLYNELTGNTIQDTVKLYLRNTASPFAVIDSAKSEMQLGGNAFFYFKNAVNGNNYFLCVKHRNSLETWSSSGITFSDNSSSYDFTTALSKAYGNNMVNKGNKYCLFSGDTNQDGVIDGSDLSIVANDAENSASGYLNSDVNGDLIVDAGDVSLVDNNANNSVVKITP